MRQTLTQHLLSSLVAHPDRAQLALIMNDLATIGKFISRETNRAGLVDILGAAGYINVQNEEVKKLDVFSNDLCKNYLRETGHFAALASEEEDNVVHMSTRQEAGGSAFGGEGKGKDAEYIIAFDPLDGSSNIDVNVSIGTIFSVHKRRLEFPVEAPEQFFQSGREQVLAGYILYGSSTVLVFSFGDGVYEFTLDQGLGEFLLSRERIRIPEKCEIYSVNEANTPQTTSKDQKFVEYLKTETKCRTRYIGSLVADAHRNMIKGGVFMYPGVDKDGSGNYKGHLRLNFEAKPMAFLYEQAGGLAVDGTQNILDVVPTALHQRIPLVMGNMDVIKTYLQN